MPLFNETIISAVIMSFFLAVLVFIDKRNDPGEGYAMARVWLIGVCLMVSVTIVNSTVQNQWNYNYIIAFLSLKEVGSWLFRILAALSYLFIIMGSVSLLAIGLKRLFKKA